MPTRLFAFPNPVDEHAARSVAALVVALTAVTLIYRVEWLLWLLAVGFALRVASGPRFSLFGQLATRVIAPRFAPAKLVPGPPKRFAQAIGTMLSVAALAFFLVGLPTVSWVLVALITVAALLESALGICLGCAVFGRLQAIGAIPQSVCEACGDIRSRARTSVAG